MLLKEIFGNKMKVYAFVGPSGTGKSYRAQMVAGEKNTHFIIDDGLLIKDNEVVAGESAKKASTKVATVKHALFYEEKEKEEIIKAIKRYNPESILILGTSDGMVQKIAENLGLPEISETVYITDVATEQEMETARRTTADGLERTVSVNYVGPYLLTRKLLPLMDKGSRIVNMVSCTYAIGRLDFPDFFTKGRKGSFWRIPVYSNTKLALTLFTLKLAEQLRERGITVNAADPGIVSTDIITMQMWFDPLTDIFFRPFIRTPRQGADTAIRLLLDKEWEQTSGRLFASGRPKTLSAKFTPHAQQNELWELTEKTIKPWLND